MPPEPLLPDLPVPDPQEPDDRMLKWFTFTHLPPQLRATSRLFYVLAIELCQTVPEGPERTVALRKLLESKDAAVRALVHPGG